MAKTQDQEFVEFIIKSLVSHPEDVKIERNVDEMGVLLTVKLNPGDVGQVIGRGGSIIRAIRTLVRIIGLKNRARINLKIEEPQGSTSQKSQEKTKNVEEVLEDLKQ